MPIPPYQLLMHKAERCLFVSINELFKAWININNLETYVCMYVTKLRNNNSFSTLLTPYKCISQSVVG